MGVKDHSYDHQENQMPREQVPDQQQYQKGLDPDTPLPDDEDDEEGDETEEVETDEDKDESDAISQRP
jgi:hypothetical protein